MSVDLVERGVFSPDDIGRLLEGLDELIGETDYQNWQQGDFRTSTLTYVRTNAVRVARALKKAGHTNPVIEEWIATGFSDPIPEVRYVADKDE